MQSEEIIGILPIGKMKAVDIEIDSDDHIFFANGIATSNSHSVSYAIQAYQSAYQKHHYTLKFFKNWLIDSGDKSDPKLEVKQLIMSAKSKGIEVKGPTIKYLEENFHVKGRSIYFGICSVKNVGAAHLKSLIDNKADKVESWNEMLFFVLPNVNSRAVSCLIQTGAFSILGKTRTEMLHEFTCLQDISEKELEWIKSNYHPNMTLVGHLKLLARTKKEGGGCHNKSRVDKVIEIIKKLENPGRSMADNPFTYSKKEEELLGLAVSQSELSSNASAAYANSTCKEVNDGRMEKVSIAGIVNEVKTIKTKKGDPMCFITIEDETGELEGIVVFPKIYEQHHSILYLGATILVSIETQTKDNSKSFIAQGIIEI